MTKRLPQPDARRVPGSVVDEVPDEGGAPDASIDVCAELGIERDGLGPAGATPPPRARSRTRIVNASLTAARSFPFSSSAVRTASMSPSAARNLSVRGSRPLRRNSCSSPLARDRRRPSHTDGVTTAPASISSSAHAARVKCSSLIGSPAVAIGARGHSQQAAVVHRRLARKATPGIQPTVASDVRRRCRE